MNNPKMQALNALAPLAKSLRDRQEQIENKLKKWHEITSDLVVDAAEQGRDILNAKTKLGGKLRWSEWLHAHVPNLTEAQAGKYERIAVEQLSDPRQCVFAFLPAPEREDKPERAKAPAWEIAWGYMTKLRKSFSAPQAWPETRLEWARTELEPVAKKLWPERWA